MTYMGLDFETYSPVDIREHGLARYVEHPDFRVLYAVLATPGFSSTGMGGAISRHFDFVLHDYDVALRRLKDDLLQLEFISAHNAAFEAAVLERIGISTERLTLVDTAVLSRMAGGSSSLADAARQFLSHDKLEVGTELIQLFCVPQEEGQLKFDKTMPLQYPAEWRLFGDYCQVDASLSAELVQLFEKYLSDAVLDVTHKMNQRGWNVDVELVNAMQARYEQNCAESLEDFRSRIDSGKGLNFNSPKQLQAWCKERGISLKSFNALAVEKAIHRIEKRLMVGTFSKEKREGYEDVLAMLNIKQDLGGSSLAKLKKILDLVSDDDRLRNNYVHVGAGQTGRTSGTGVQMQNLKRLGNVPDDIEYVASMSNDRLARNIRQVFTASHPGGKLIVGDFSSVESRGLAWLAGEQWVIDTFASGKGLYEQFAAKYYNVAYDQVTKQQRQFGKVGELSCGYGAGAGAVKDFAEAMGVDLTMQEAAEIVAAWREQHPESVLFWDKLERAMRQALTAPTWRRIYVGMPATSGVEISFSKQRTPATVTAQKHNATNIEMTISFTSLDGRKHTAYRTFVGCYLQGTEIRYHKPSGTKTGPVWRDYYVDKDGKRQPLKLYGGKLTGIVTQSFCRELFFYVAEKLEEELNRYPNMQLIGQFHDELVVDWYPSAKGEGLHRAETRLAAAMSSTIIHGFPLAAEVHSDYRYIK